MSASRRCSTCRDRTNIGEQPLHPYACLVCGHCQRVGAEQVPACPGCEDKIRGELTALVEFYALLADELEPGAAAPSDGTRHTKADAAPIPVRLEVLNLRQRGGLVDVLASWEQAWREDRGQRMATFRGDTEQTLTGVVEFLQVNLAWAAQHHPAVDEFAREVHELHATCQRLLGEDERRFSPGPCPVTLDDGTACGRRLLVDPYGTGNVSCGATPGHEWPADTLMLLGRQLAEQADAG